MGILSKTVAVICGCLLWTIGSSDGASAAGFHPCPEYEYWDHGTEHCEPCRGLCDQAKHRNTVEECMAQCPAYAQVLWPPESPTLKPPNNNKNDGNNNNNNTSEFPPNTWIGIVALGLVCILVSAVFFVKRKAIKAKIRGINPRPTIPGQTAVVLQPVTPVPTPEDGSFATTVGGGSGGSGSGGTAGIQEQGGPCPEAAGNHCYQIFPSESESEPFLKQQPRTPAPIPVSPEGQSGDHAMALLHYNCSGGAYSTPRSCFFPTTFDYSAPPDMDSTEPKTLQSSLDRIDCLLPGADGTMQSSRV